MFGMGKMCTKCKVEKNFLDFTKYHKSKDGYYGVCKSCQKEYRDNMTQEQKDNRSKNNSKWYNKNIEKEREKARVRKRIAYKNDPQKHKDFQRQNIKNKIKNNPMYKLRQYIGNNIRNSLRYGIYTERSITFKVVGLLNDELIKILNSNKFGFKYGDDGIDLGYIVPLSSAKSEKELKSLYHYSNMILLPSYYNRYVKSNKIYNEKHLLEWLDKQH